jgi:penicillin-binding protein 2
MRQTARVRPAVAVLVVASAVLGACRASGPPPEGTPTLPPPAVTSVSAPDPELTARMFLDAWQEARYEDMYAMLSPLTTDSLSQEDFIARYEGVRQNGAIDRIDYEIVSSLVSPREAQVRYRINLHSSAAGDLVRETWIDLKRMDDDWKVAWTEEAILPELAGGNNLYLDFTLPTRANIYDRNGLALVTQTDVVGVYVVPSLIGDEDAESAMLRALSRLFSQRSENLQALYEPFRGTDFLVPIGEASLEDFQRVQGTLESVGGVGWRIYPSRFYLNGGLAPQAVGYVSQINEGQLEEYINRGYRRDEFVGQTGLERVFEEQLRGKPGGTLYLTDAGGNIIKDLASEEPQPSQAVYTTLDRDLQRQAQEAIAEFRGAVVVLERDTGRVLALASSPGFNPNLFDSQNPNSPAGLSDLLSDLRNPLVDRATVSGYPLGSVFKLITMAAALETGAYTPDTAYVCDGEFRELPGQVFYDWTVAKELPDHGEVTLMQGLERSCNPYFWHIGLDLFTRGLPTALVDMATAFGLGAPTGLEIGDSGGLLPNPEWKQANMGEDWTAGDAVQLAIGQASLNVTPLQVARFAAALGNGGTLYTPYLVDRVQSAEGEVSYRGETKAAGDLGLKSDTLSAITQAMLQVVRADKGTARRPFLGLNLNVAGKTGTAESGIEDPHAWFAGYTFEEREDKPDIAVAVLVENQGEGSDWAAPVFRRIVESYFLGGPRSLYPWEEQIGVTREETPTPEPGQEGAQATPAP